MMKQNSFVSSRQVCRECGCACNMCDSNNLDLHHEIEELKAKLLSCKTRSSVFEQEFCESQRTRDMEHSRLQDELTKLRDRYDRLFESHKKLQKINHNLEDKLITVVEKLEHDKAELAEYLRIASQQCIDAEATIRDLEEESERYKNDCNLAVQLLQCKPSEFVAHRLDTLPLDLQERTKSMMSAKELADLEASVAASSAVSVSRPVHVVMPTFPPTAFYSVPSARSTTSATSSPLVERRGDRTTATSTEDMTLTGTVSTAVIARVLSHPNLGRIRSTQRSTTKVRCYVCANCRGITLATDAETQTTEQATRPPHHSNQLHASPRSSAPGVHKPHRHSPDSAL